MKGTKYEEYALNNQILDKSPDFIQKKTGTAKFSFSIIYQNTTYGIWNDFSEGKIFVSNDYDPNSPYTFSMTLKDHRPNTMMINALRNYGFWKRFVENFNLGNVYFENQKIKHDMYQILKLYSSR